MHRFVKPYFWNYIYDTYNQLFLLTDVRYVCTVYISYPGCCQIHHIPSNDEGYQKSLHNYTRSCLQDSVILKLMA